MKRFITILFSVMLSGQVVLSEDQEPVRLTLDSEKSVFYKPEDIWVEVQFVANRAGGTSVALPYIYDGESHLRFEIVKESAKEDSKLPYKGSTFFGSREKVHIPKERPLKKLINLKHYYDMTAPGSYRVRAVYSDRISGLDVASEQLEIEIRAADSIKVLADRKHEGKILELLKLKDAGGELFMLTSRHASRYARKDDYYRCRRLSSDLTRLRLPSVSTISIVDVAESADYTAVTISLGKSTSLLIDRADHQPEIFDTIVDKPATSLKCKKLKNGRHIWVDGEGQEYGYTEEKKEQME